jgi:hypothetical protein
MNPMPKPLDAIHRVLRGEAPPPPIATLLGFTLMASEPGRAVVAFEAAERHATRWGRSTAACSATSPTWRWAGRTPPLLPMGRVSPPWSSRSTSCGRCEKGNSLRWRG